METRNSNIKRFAFLYSVLVLVPLFFSLLLAYHIAEFLQKHSQQEIEAAIDERAATLQNNLTPENIYLPVFRGLAKQIISNQEQPSPIDIHKLVKSVFAKSKLEFNICVFDHQGKIVLTGLAPPEASAPFQYLWGSINDESGQYNYDGRKADVAKFLGRRFNTDLIDGKNDICLPTFNYGKKGLFYHCKSTQGKNGVIFFLELDIDSVGILDKKVRKNSTKAQPIVMLHKNGARFAESGFEEFFELLRLDSESAPQKIFIQNEYLWKHLKIGDSSLLLGQNLNNWQYAAAKKLCTIVITLLAIITFAVFYRKVVHGQGIRVSIRYKLVAIFIFSVYIPLLGLFMLGFNNLDDHRKVLENNAKKGIQDQLFKIDTGFAQKEEEILEIFERLYKDHEWHKKLDKDWKEADLAIRRSARVKESGDNFFNWMEIRDVHHNQLFCTSRGEANNRIKAMGKAMSIICLEKFAPQRLQEAQSKTSQSDLVRVNMLENPVIGLSHLFEQPGRLIPMNFEGSNIYWYWNYYSDPKSTPAILMGNTRAGYNTISYLEKILKTRFSLDDTAIKIIAYLPDHQLWIPDIPADNDELRELIGLSALKESVTSAKIMFDGKSYLATTLPGIKLDGLFISCLYPESEITQKIAKLEEQLYLGMIIILLAAVLTGLLLSKTFLAPVAELNMGLNALRKRDTSFRVNIENHDELGELGTTFNHMMEEVREMLLAGAVQQCLIPETCPLIEGYEGLIYNKMATDVGGDYADILALPQNRYLITIGDVTGHGISSSILTAMVKALVFRFTTQNAELPVLLKSISEMIFDLLKHRKLMTFCAVILDQKDNSFVVANAGHPFPVLCRASGETHLIEHSSLPLGVSIKRSNYSTVKDHLEPGDILMLYTDGMPEGTNSQGEIFGFERVEKIVAENRKNNIEDIQNTLLQNFWEHYQREDLDDDLTFIIIRRCNNKSTDAAAQSA